MRSPTLRRKGSFRRAIFMRLIELGRDAFHRLSNKWVTILSCAFLPYWNLVPCSAFDYENHRLVNQLALGSLPDDFPAFVKTAAARDRVAFLSGEPDRWRNSKELSLQHASNPDHFIDIEDLVPLDLEPSSLSPFRYEFVAQIARARDSHPERFRPIDPARDLDRTRRLVGFLPWTITEHYGKLKSAFSYLKVFEEDGTTYEIANARENVIYIMGTMGHFVGDAAQPLHTTRHYNGWVGKNPSGFTTNRTFHSWIDGGFLARAGQPTVHGLQPRLRPARLLWETLSGGTNSPVFARALNYVLEQHKLVEPLYRLEKEGKLNAEQDSAKDGKAFLEGQFVKAAQMLGDLWYSAWRDAPPDQFLKMQLAKRKSQGVSPAQP